MASKNVFVSIIITNYNYGQFLRYAIDSALNQNYRYVEVIVVDDGSTDASRCIIEEYKNRVIPVLKKMAGMHLPLMRGLMQAAVK